MKIKRLHKKAILPKYATTGASAFDVFAYEEPKWELNNNNLWTAIIPTGWAFEIPLEYGLFILSRSGHGFNFDTTLANSVGLLDWDYRGQMMVKIICFGDARVDIQRGVAIAQCALIETPRVLFKIIEDLSETERGENGFGSTDKAIKC